MPQHNSRSISSRKCSLGKSGEALAAKYLIQMGYQIEAKNWVGLVGEIDIVALIHDTLVIVEVRTLSTQWLSRPAEAVPMSKQCQVARCADEYVRLRARTAKTYQDVRFDVIGVFIPPEHSKKPSLHPKEYSHPIEVDHVEDAFHSPWAF